MNKHMFRLACAGLTLAALTCGEGGLDPALVAQVSKELEAAGVNAGDLSSAVAVVTGSTDSIGETIATIETVTDLATSVTDISETSSTLQSTSTSSASTSSESTFGIRGAPRRQVRDGAGGSGPIAEARNEGHPQGPDLTKCEGASPLPCFCVMHFPDKFVGKETQCVEMMPPAEGSREAPRQILVTVNVTKLEEGDAYKISMSVSGIPANANIPEDVKKDCKAASDGTLTCGREFVETKRCNPDDPAHKNAEGKLNTDACPYVAAPPSPPGQDVLVDVRLKRPDELGAPADFSKKEDVVKWLTPFVEQLEAAGSDQKQLKQVLGQLLTPEPGWVTEVRKIHCAPGNEKNALAEGCPPFEKPQPGPDGHVPPHPVKEVGARFFSHPVPPPPKPGDPPPPVPEGYGGELRAMKIEGTGPGGNEIKTRVFRVMFESPDPAGTACTPSDLKGTALTTLAGRKVLQRFAEIEEHGSYGFGSGSSCRAFEQPAAPEPGKQPVPPTGYVSEERNGTRQFKEPEPNKAGERPPLYPVSESVNEKVYMIIRAPELVAQETKEAKPEGGLRDRMKDAKSGEGDQTDAAHMNRGQADKCPGKGEGIREVTTRFSDGPDEKRTERYIKKEGECRPIPLGPDGQPIEIVENADGSLEGKAGKVKDKEGKEHEVAFKVKNPDSETKVVSIDAGFVTGDINFHAPDDEGIVAEGKLSVSILNVSVEVNIELSEAGWQHVRGKMASGGKTIVFWQDRTKSGAYIKFKLLTKDADLSETPEGVTANVEAEGELDLAEGTSEGNACEVTGEGEMTLNTGTDSGTSLSISIYEDSSSLVTTSDGTAVEQQSGCATSAAPASTSSTTGSSTGS